MNLQELLELIPFYVAGTLDPDEKRLVEQELPNSTELQEAVRFWRQAQKAIIASEEYARKGHLSPDTLIQYVEGNLGVVEMNTVEQHISECANCREETDSITEMYSRLEAPPVLQRVKEALHSSLDYVLEYLRPPRLAYAVPALLVIIISTAVLIWHTRETAAIETLFELPYQEITRAAGKTELPKFEIGKKTEIINMVILVPHLAIDSLQYMLSLTTPSGRAMPFRSTITPILSGSNYDTVRVTLTQIHFAAGSGEYKITLTANPPIPLEGAATLKYDYRFIVSRSAGN